jgi:hypothetical protein
MHRNGKDQNARITEWREGGGMKKISDGLIFVLLTVSGSALLVGNALAEISMSERETVQAIVWVVEILTFLTAVAIGWFVLRMIKRDSKNRKSKKDKS